MSKDLLSYFPPEAREAFSKVPNLIQQVRGGARFAARLGLVVGVLGVTADSAIRPPAALAAAEAPGIVLMAESQAGMADLLADDRDNGGNNNNEDDKKRPVLPPKPHPTHPPPLP